MIKACFKLEIFTFCYDCVHLLLFMLQRLALSVKKSLQARIKSIAAIISKFHRKLLVS